MRDTILKALQDATGEKNISLEFPENEAFGDYSSNVAMVAGHKAEEIVEKLREDKTLTGLFSKIEVAGPGFINFFLSEKALLDELASIEKQQEKYGTSDLGGGKTVIVDYSSPNIAKRFGIGHLRSTVIGQSLYNLYRFLGYKVIGDNHLGDWGTQFGTLLYQIDSKGLNASEQTIDELEKLYVEFNSEAQENEKLWDKARAWFKKLEEKDARAREIWQKVVDTSLKEFEKIYEILGVKIDYAYGESFYLDKMPSVIEELKKKGLLTESQGAKIIEFKDLPPAIVVKSDGATTYLTRDLATIRFRIGEWKPDILIYEVGSDQTLYFRQLFETVRLLGWKGNSEFVHVAHGLIRFEHGKMSTRKGDTVKLEGVISEAIDRARKIKDDVQIATAVGIGAIKYFDLMHHPSTDIIFDWEKIFVLEGNSAPYLQYTVARANSVLEKGRKSSPKGKIALNQEELVILRSLTRFSEIIVIAAKSYSPNLLANYLFDLAQKFNNFYNQHRIVGGENEELRLALTAGTRQVLKNGLAILGIETPQRM